MRIPLLNIELTTPRPPLAITPESVREALIDVLSTTTPNQVSTDKVEVGSVRGASGTQWFGGLLTGEEYNADLQGDNAIRVYDRMRRSDGQVKALLMACKLPLLNADWSVKAASEDAEDVEIAQFVQDNLMGGMRITWQDVLWHILTQLDFGFAVCEAIYDVGQDKKIRLTSLAPRLAKTIYRWYSNGEDELDRIQQRVYRQSDDGMTGSYEFPMIYRPNLCVFSFQREGNNWTGIALLRAVYKHWYIKDQLYGIDSIAAERNGMGVPWAIAPANTQKSDRDAAANALSSLHSHQRSYIQFPFGWTWGLMGVSGQVRDTMRSIEHHDMMIVRSGLASFLSLSGGDAQSHSRDLSTFFLMSLRALAKGICETINKDVIRRLVDLNFTVERYPTIEVTRIDMRDIDQFLQGFASMVGVGAITPSPDTENAVRSMLNLPDLPEGATVAGGGVPTVDTDSGGVNEAEKLDKPTEPPPPADAALSELQAFTEHVRRIYKPKTAISPAPNNDVALATIAALRASTARDETATSAFVEAADTMHALRVGTVVRTIYRDDEGRPASSEGVLVVKENDNGQ